ncbi:MAG: hypothetical protein V4723_12985 [Pseudomonadota bacterium]
METERDEVITTKERLRDEHSAWSDEPGAPRKNERHTINIVLSMPEGADAGAVRRASRAFAKSLFADTNQYLMAVHHPGNDPDSKHPHAYLTVKARGYDGSRLDPKKAESAMTEEISTMNTHPIRPGPYEAMVAGVKPNAQAFRGSRHDSLSETTLEVIAQRH